MKRKIDRRRFLKQSALAGAVFTFPVREAVLLMFHCPWPREVVDNSKTAGLWYDKARQPVG